MEEAYREVQFAVYGNTVLHPIILVLTLILCIISIKGKRHTLIYLFIIQGLFITIEQRYVINSLDFPIIRILSIVTLIRILIRSEYKKITINHIDKLILAWIAVGIIMPTLLFKSLDVFLRAGANNFDYFCMYFVWRISVRNISELIRVLKFIIILMVPIVGLMINEQVSGKNILSVFGGVPELTFEREGRLRSQAAFGHPISAGTFGATFLPLFIGLLNYSKAGKTRIYSAILCCFIIIILSSSSGPILSLFAAIFGMTLWFFREYIRLIVWLIVYSLFFLHLIMKAPVWFLIARVAVVGGSTAYYRAALIDAAIQRFPEWWIMGTRQTGHWGWGFQDVTNMYIRQAVGGGLLKLVLFCAIIFFCFKTVGSKIKSLEGQKDLQFFIWMFGVSLFTHCVSILGINYFDQMLLFWFGILAIISSTCIENKIVEINICN